MEPDSARLPLLVATAADGVWLVGGQKYRMVQTFFRRVLPRGGNHRAIFYLGTAPFEIDCCGIGDFSPTRDRDHGKLLLFQPAHDRALLAADRRRFHPPPQRGGANEPGVAGAPPSKRKMDNRTTVHLRRNRCDHRDITDQCVVNFQRI